MHCILRRWRDKAGFLISVCENNIVSIPKVNRKCAERCILFVMASMGGYSGTGYFRSEMRESADLHYVVALFYAIKFVFA